VADSCKTRKKTPVQRVRCFSALSSGLTLPPPMKTARRAAAAGHKTTQRRCQPPVRSGLKMTIFVGERLQLFCGSSLKVHVLIAVNAVPSRFSRNICGSPRLYYRTITWLELRKWKVTNSQSGHLQCPLECYSNQGRQCVSLSYGNVFSDSLNGQWRI